MTGLLFLLGPSDAGARLSERGVWLTPDELDSDAFGGYGVLRVALAANGKLYAGTNDEKIFTLDPSGKKLVELIDGRAGSGCDFGYLFDLAADAAGNPVALVRRTDENGGGTAINRYSQDGRCVQQWTGPADDPLRAEQVEIDPAEQVYLRELDEVRRFSLSGQQTGSFDLPGERLINSMASAPNGDIVYVEEWDAERTVVRRGPDGQTVGSWPLPLPPYEDYSQQSLGGGVQAVGVDARGTVYVLENWPGYREHTNGMLWEFTGDGQLVRRYLYSPRSENKAVFFSTDLAVAADGQSMITNHAYADGSINDGSGVALLLRVPLISLTSGPKSVSTVKTARFTWTSDEPGATYECRVKEWEYGGKADWAPCEQPLLLRDLGPGRLLVSVRGVLNGRPGGPANSNLFDGKDARMKLRVKGRKAVVRLPCNRSTKCRHRAKMQAKGVGLALKKSRYVIAPFGSKKVKLRLTSRARRALGSRSRLGGKLKITGNGRYKRTRRAVLVR